MKKFSAIICILLVSVGFNSCTKKDTRLHFIETQCNKMKIENPTYDWLPTGTCSSDPLTGSISVSFDYLSDEACLHLIRMGKVEFFAGANQIPATYTESREVSSALVSKSGQRVTFTWCYTMNSQANWDALTHIILRWNVENEIGNWSNSLLLRINIPGKPVDPSTYTVKQTVNVNDDEITFRLWDHASEDGDIVSVNLNDVWIIEHHTLSIAGHYFTAKIKPGDNHLIIFAENEGSSGPNTCSISINNGQEIKLEPNLLTGEAVNIQF